tara:strand:- start:2806 stop:4761 length:1956 start_codon:yes stop_codon:yes gene_type:complete
MPLNKRNSYKSILGADYSDELFPEFTVTRANEFVNKAPANFIATTTIASPTTVVVATASLDAHNFHNGSNVQTVAFNGGDKTITWKVFTDNQAFNTTISDRSDGGGRGVFATSPLPTTVQVMNTNTAVTFPVTGDSGNVIYLDTDVTNIALDLNTVVRYDITASTGSVAEINNTGGGANTAIVDSLNSYNMKFMPLNNNTNFTVDLYNQAGNVFMQTLTLGPLDVHNFWNLNANATVSSTSSGSNNYDPTGWNAGLQSEYGNKQYDHHTRLPRYSEDSKERNCMVYMGPGTFDQPLAFAMDFINNEFMAVRLQHPSNLTPKNTSKYCAVLPDLDGNLIFVPSSSFNQSGSGPGGGGGPGMVKKVPAADVRNMLQNHGAVNVWDTSNDMAQMPAYTNSGTLDEYATGVVAYTGIIYCCGQGVAGLLKIDTTAGTVTKILTGMGKNITGIIQHPNGYLYAIQQPADGHSVIKIDHINGTYTKQWSSISWPSGATFNKIVAATNYNINPANRYRLAIVGTSNSKLYVFGAILDPATGDLPAIATERNINFSGDPVTGVVSAPDSQIYISAYGSSGGRNLFKINDTFTSPISSSFSTNEMSLNTLAQTLDGSLRGPADSLSTTGNFLQSIIVTNRNESNAGARNNWKWGGFQSRS